MMLQSVCVTLPLGGCLLAGDKPETHTIALGKADPLGNGANIFGTASVTVNYALLSAGMIWAVQVIALVSGHVGGLMLAHDRALTTYDDHRRAMRSQRYMLVVMVGFTSLGLWLLSGA